MRRATLRPLATKVLQRNQPAKVQVKSRSAFETVAFLTELLILTELPSQSQPAAAVAAVSSLLPSHVGVGFLMLLRV